MSSKRHPIAIDLFSGCGGLTTGLKCAGFRVIAAVEKDYVSVHTYRQNHRKCAVIHDDIASVSPQSIMKQLCIKPGELDLLAGCPPCQGFSSLRRIVKEGNDFPENMLVQEFCKFVMVFQPRSVMLENVPRLGNHVRFSQLVSFLNNDGYSVNYSVLDASNFLVPQRRRRLILLAYRNRMPIRFCNPRKRMLSVYDAIGELPSPNPVNPVDPAHDYVVFRNRDVICRIQAIPKDGGSRLDLGESNQLPCHKKTKGFRDVYGRMQWDTVAPTLTTGCISPSKGRFLHPSENRAITVREAALLQSFPPDYWIDMDFGHHRAAQLIGNAFPPRFATAHARKIYLRLRDDGLLD